MAYDIRIPVHVLPLWVILLSFFLLGFNEYTADAAEALKPLAHADKVTRTTSGQVDMCLACHREQPDRAHGRDVLGCYVCHLGNPLTGDKDKAHRGMLLNPGDLRYARKTCGQSGCHVRQVRWVESSLMATNRGILSTLRYYWGESKNQNEDITVRDLIEKKLNSPALSYYRKLCATCHLWMKKGVLPGFLAEKGGGCSACHSVEAPGKGHVQILKAVPLKNCVRCHNRSGRIGLSYQGIYESEGYGTPYVQGDLSDKQLDDGRYYHSLPDDIHHRSGLVCIDCHTQKEVMGDGKAHAHMEQQVRITCRTCHAKAESLKRAMKEDAKRIARDKGPADLPDFVLKKGRVFLKGKIDHKLHKLKPPKPFQCASGVHRRLSCQACHSTWVPQCYGCHVRVDYSKTQLDKLTLKKTPGQWQEFRSFIRFEAPPLGMLGPGPESGSSRQSVVILVPGCQDMVSFLDTGGRWTGDFKRLTVSWMDPHTTQKGSRTCRGCHVDSRALALGLGNLWFSGKNKWEFTPALRPDSKDLGISPPLDAFVDIDGHPLVHFSRPWLRTFNRKEISRILYVGLCLDCHKGWNDPVMRSWKSGSPPAPCSRAFLVDKYPRANSSISPNR